MVRSAALLALVMALARPIAAQIWGDATVNTTGALPAPAARHPGRCGHAAPPQPGSPPFGES
jgi:hypothetical protein